MWINPFRQVVIWYHRDTLISLFMIYTTNAQTVCTVCQILNSMGEGIINFKYFCLFITCNEIVFQL